jgi:hypothetical protein
MSGSRLQFGLGASLHHSVTPSLRAAGFEDEDDDENEAPQRVQVTESGPTPAGNGEPSMGVRAPLAAIA